MGLLINIWIELLIREKRHRQSHPAEEVNSQLLPLIPAYAALIRAWMGQRLEATASLQPLSTIATFEDLFSTETRINVLQMWATPAEWEELLNTSEALFHLVPGFITLISASVEHALFDHNVFQLGLWFKHMYFTCSSLSLFKKQPKLGENLKSVLLKNHFYFLGVFLKFFHPLYNFFCLLICIRPNQSQSCCARNYLHSKKIILVVS